MARMARIKLTSTDKEKLEAVCNEIKGIAEIRVPNEVYVEMEIR
jgi:ribosomal protein S10